MKCVLPRIKAQLEKPDDLSLIMDLFETMTEVTISEVMSRFRLSRPTAGRKLSALVKKGLIEKKGADGDQVISRSDRYSFRTFKF